MSLHDRRLYLLFTPALCANDPWDTLAAALDGGVDLVQWRPVEAGVEADAEAGHVSFQRCREACQRAGVPLLVNDDVMLAVRGRAAGAHVGQNDIPAHAARRLLGRQWLGVSTHDVPQITAAVAAGADYVGFGPCHATATKGYTEGKTPAAIEAATTAAQALRVPLFAIGGITAANVPALRMNGVDRIAVSSAILQDADPRRAAEALRRWL
jgi:thiamine-phosphate pyrophosphorylase